MKSKIITLFEHEKKDYKDLGWRPDDPRISQLERFINGIETPALSFGRHSLKANQYVGVVRLGDLMIQILPKIDYEGNSDVLIENEVRQKAVNTATRNLLFMLSYTHDLQIRAKDLANLKDQPADWFELLTRLFASDLHAQLRLGLEHAYVRREETISVIRGRWLLSQQLAARPFQRHLFDVTYDEFSPDTSLNQIFLLVTRLLLPQTIDIQNKRYLQDIRDWLDEITPISSNLEELISQVHFNRLNERFRPAFNLAQFFLKGFTYQLHVGEKEIFAFVLDMNRLFEGFVGQFLKRKWEGLNFNRDVKINLQSQGNRVFLAEYLVPPGKPVFELIPDIQFLHQSGKLKLIADTKYKRLDPSAPHVGVSQDDIYQMIAYSVRLDCPQLLLLYPQSHTGQIRVTLNIKGHPQTIRIATLNLHTPLDHPDQLIHEFQEIFSPLFST